MNLLFITDQSKTEFNNTVDKILQRPEYNSLTNDVSNYIDRVKEWLAEKLMDLLSGLFSGASIGSGLSTIIIIITLTILTVLIIYIVVKIGRTFERKKRLKEILGEKIDENTTPAILKAKAAEFKRAGDLRQGIRFDFIALLLLMHERNIVYLDDTKTNEEILRYLTKKRFPLTRELRDCINIFNLIWYGHKLVSNEIYEEWSKSVTALWNEVNVYEAKNK